MQDGGRGQDPSLKYDRELSKAAVFYLESRRRSMSTCIFRAVDTQGALSPGTAGCEA